MAISTSQLWITLMALSSASGIAAPIRNLVFTEVIKDVAILDASTKKERPAKVGETLVSPNILRTGPDSRAELIAEDKTVTRIGSNTVFSVDANTRDVNLSKGSVLFHSPTGKGGGTIKSAGATASVLGTTLIVGANQNAGFKVMLLEGKGEVKAPGSQAVKVAAGQLSFAMPGQKPSAPLNFELRGQVASSKLISGFSKPVASIAKINDAIAKQESKLAKGDLAQTDLLIGDRPDTAFKLDANLVTVVTTVKQREQEKEELPSRNIPDPRYLQALSKRLQLTDVADGSHVFAVDGSGAGKDKGYGLPKSIPGNQQPDGTVSALIAQEITLQKSSSGFFLPLPVDVPSDINHAAVLALNNLVIEADVEFVGLSSSYGNPIEVVGADGTVSTRSVEEWRPLTQLLLSAGNTISIAPGSTVRADVPIFELYAAGSAFSADLNLTEATPTNPRGIVWDGIQLTNQYSADASSNSSAASGLIRINAPALQLFRSEMSAGNLTLSATGDIVLNNAVDASPQPLKLPIGFTSVDELNYSAVDTLRITSSRKAISIKSVNLSANVIALSAATDLSLDKANLQYGDFNQNNSSATLAADEETGTISLIDSTLTLDSISMKAKSIVMRSQGDLILDQLAKDATPATTTVRETKTVLRAQAVDLRSLNGNLNASNLTVESRDPSTSSFKATAAEQLTLNKVNLNQAQNVALEANTIALSDTSFKQGSAVAMKSKEGLVAADPGHGRSVKYGLVNFVRNVTYGGAEIKFLSGSDLTHAEFNAQVPSNVKNNITIGKR